LKKARKDPYIYLNIYLNSCADRGPNRGLFLTSSKIENSYFNFVKISVLSKKEKERKKN